MTGAPLPPGADAVVMVEHVYRDGKALHLPGARTLRAGENVVPQGAEARAGDLVVPSGTRLQAAEIALAASLGYAEVPVFAQPRVAILSTGDELVELGEQPATHQIRNSNSHGLAALVRSNGGAPHRAKPVADDISALEKAIAQERDAPLLVLSGGVSAGRYDFVEHALAAHGAEFFFTGVKMQPGKPVVFARLPATETHNVQWVFGLPGNPVSTQVTFLLFVAPLLRALGGEKDPTPHFVEARLARAVPGKPGLTRFLPARLSSSLDGAQAEVLGWQGSGDLAANARANCYAVLPAIGEDMPAGTSVAVLLR
jgi:molybdopterin molybdotransferase